MSSPMLASDDANPNFVGARNPDDALHVVFYSKPILQPYRTKMEGHPIFEDVDMVRIHTPGNQLNIVDTPVRPEHKRRFPKHWAHYVNSKGKEGIVGTPLKEWPLLTAGQAMTIQGLGFHSVEQVANASDEAIQRVGMVSGMAAFVFRDRARIYLQTAKDGAFAAKQAEELKKRDEQIEQLTKQVAELAAKMAQPAPVAPAASVSDVQPTPEREALVAQYVAKFGKKPHHKMSVVTIKEKLAA